MNRSRESLEAEAMRLLEEVKHRFPEYREALLRVEIRLSQRLTRSAGNADPRTGLIQLSEPIFRLEENTAAFKNTVLHEIAHIIVGPDVRAHGAEWRATFLQLGGNGQRTHNLRSSGQHRTHQASCSRCGDEIELGTRRFRRLVAGARDYMHVGCGGTIVPHQSQIELRQKKLQFC